MTSQPATRQQRWGITAILKMFQWTTHSVLGSEIPHCSPEHRTLPVVMLIVPPSRLPTSRPQHPGVGQNRPPGSLTPQCSLTFLNGRAGVVGPADQRGLVVHGCCTSPDSPGRLSSFSREHPYSHVMLAPTWNDRYSGSGHPVGRENIKILPFLQIAFKLISYIM